MKRVLLTLIVVCRCYAGDSSDIKTVIWDSPRHDEGGRPVAHEEKTFRGTEEILKTLRMRTGGVIQTARFFTVSGDTVLIESDEGGSGKFDTLILYNRAKGGMEVFKRQADGSVKPVDEKTLAAFKRQDIALSRFWDKIFGPNAPLDKSIESEAKALKSELQDAEKQKNGNEK